MKEETKYICPNCKTCYVRETPCGDRRCRDLSPVPVAVASPTPQEPICGKIISSGKGKIDGHACWNKLPCPDHSPEPINMCDGCQRGLPVEDGDHYNNVSGLGRIVIGCTKERYTQQKKTCDCIRRLGSGLLHVPECERYTAGKDTNVPSKKASQEEKIEKCEPCQDGMCGGCWKGQLRMYCSCNHIQVSSSPTWKQEVDSWSFDFSANGEACMYSDRKNNVVVPYPQEFIKSFIEKVVEQAKAEGRAECYRDMAELDAILVGENYDAWYEKLNKKAKEAPFISLAFKHALDGMYKKGKVDGYQEGLKKAEDAVACGAMLAERARIVEDIFKIFMDKNDLVSCGLIRQYEHFVLNASQAQAGEETK